LARLVPRPPSGDDPLRDQKIETFGFPGLVDTFDAVRTANPAPSSWALNNALPDHHLSSSDTTAPDSDLAYRYGQTGSLAGIKPGYEKKPATRTAARATGKHVARRRAFYGKSTVMASPSSARGKRCGGTRAFSAHRGRGRPRTFALSR
jgi:hypothetical protein